MSIYNGQVTSPRIHIFEDRSSLFFRCIDQLLISLRSIVPSNGPRSIKGESSDNIGRQRTTQLSAPRDSSLRRPGKPHSFMSKIVCGMPDDILLQTEIGVHQDSILSPMHSGARSISRVDSSPERLGRAWIVESSIMNTSCPYARLSVGPGTSGDCEHCP